MLIFEKEEREEWAKIDLRRLGHGLPTLRGGLRHGLKDMEMRSKKKNDSNQMDQL